MVAGCAFSASAMTASGKTCGMLWAVSAIRLIALSEATEPSRSTTRAAGRPKRPSRSSSSATS